MSSNERNATMKVSIDINKNTVKNSLGMKKTMKGLTARGTANRSFNMGHHGDRFKEGSPTRSDGEPKGDYSTNESDVRMSEVIQMEQEDRIRNLEKKVEAMLADKATWNKDLRRCQEERDRFRIDNEKLREANQELEHR